MKKAASILIASCLIVMNSSCAKKTTSKKTPCEAVMCTMMFAMITVDVQNASGQPVSLDSFYTLRVSTGEKLRHNNNGTLNGGYVILDDGDRHKLTNITDSFYFIGYSKGVKIVNEPYVLGADCCHVSKQSGKGSITIP